MNKYLNSPFMDHLPFEEWKYSDEVRVSKEESYLQDVGGILNKKDETLLFMTLTITLTSMNEMPMVAAYTGAIPTNIVGLHRIAHRASTTVAPHFYFDDERILQYWNKPFETESILEKYYCSISMDFSMTAEMGRPQKIFSSYKNKLFAAWLQSRGHLVIPNISFPDEWWEDYWIEGWPVGSVIALSSVGVLTHGNPSAWLKAFERIRRELKPIHILRYGPVIPGEDTSDCTYFTNDNNRLANGWKLCI